VALTVVADAGYQNGTQAAACEAADITPIVPSPAVVNPHGEYFSKTQFKYDADLDQYRCPAGEALTRYKSDQQSQTHYYTTRACNQCPLRARCTDSKQRSIARHVFAAAAERMNQRAKDQPEVMKRRKAIAEHPFAGPTYLMGPPRFLVRGVQKATAEMALTVWGYNLKRTMNILGAGAMLHTWSTA
jgi:transposase